MITNIRQSKELLTFWSDEKREPIRNRIEIDITRVALSSINRNELKKQDDEAELRFLAKLKIQFLFNALKNCISKMQAIIVVLLFLLDFCSLGIPIEIFKEVLDELSSECKRNQRDLDLIYKLASILFDAPIENPNT